MSGIPVIPKGLNNNKSTVLAPWLYGSIVGSLAIGILCMQTALYFYRYPKDRLYYKITVGLLTVTSLATWASTLAILNHAFLDGFGSILAMHAWTRVAFVPIAAPAFSGTISQAFFATRIYRLSGQKKWLGVMLILLITTSFISGLISIGVEPPGEFTPFNGNDVILFRPIDATVDATFVKVVTSIEVFLWVSAATDVLITALLFYLLLGQRRKDRSMSSTLTRILVLGLTTGGVTAFVSVADAVVVLATIWSNNVNMSLTLSLNHVYALVCISSLNVRRTMSSRHRKGSGASGLSGGMSGGTRPSMSVFSPVAEKPSLLPTPAAAVNAPAPPFAHPQRPQPPRLNTRDISGMTERFDSANALETANTGSTALSPEDYQSAYPALKGDVATQVTMPRFSYLRRAPSRDRRERPRPQFKYNQTPA